MQLLWVGLGGFVGAIGRYCVGSWVQRLLPTGQIPYGTLAVNVVGCLAIGALGGWIEGRQISIFPMLRLFLFVGVLGGFTTFSAFAFETLTMTRAGLTFAALAHVGGHLVVCLCAVGLGDFVARTLAR